MAVTGPRDGKPCEVSTAMTFDRQPPPEEMCASSVKPEHANEWNAASTTVEAHMLGRVVLVPDNPLLRGRAWQL
jgi:hypothetical protein